MIIGHLPAGYIISKLSYPGFSKHIDNYKMFMLWGILGSIAPDIDMLYYFLIDHQSTHHHRYFTHFPVFWLVLILLAAAFCLSHKTRKYFGIYALIFSVMGFCHLLLDTVVGDIWWMGPFIDRRFALAVVPALYKPWWLNFILHWSFLLEIAITLWAGWLWKHGSVNSTRTVATAAAQITDFVRSPQKDSPEQGNA